MERPPRMPEIILTDLRILSQSSQRSGSRLGWSSEVLFKQD